MKIFIVDKILDLNIYYILLMKLPLIILLRVNEVCQPLMAFY